MRIDGRVGRLVSSVVWLGFEAMFANAILVFVIVWLVLLPFSYITSKDHSASGLLSPLALCMHNVNLLLMVRRSYWISYSQVTGLVSKLLD